MTTIEYTGKERSKETFSETASALHSGNEHPSINLPFSVVIDGRSYDGISVSMAQAKVSGLAAPGLTQATRLAMFRFDFGAFVFSLPIAVIVDTANSETGQLALTFSEPAGPHMPQLRYILNAWLAGDVVNLHDMLQAKSRLPKTAGGANTHITSRRLLSKLLGIALTTAASVLFVFGASALVSSRVYQHNVEGPAVAVWNGPMLRATVSGQLSFFANNPTSNQPLYTIESSSGASVTAVMPCDCSLREKYVDQGATVLAGDPVVQLSGADETLVVEARFSSADLNALSDEAAIAMTMADGTVLPARLDNVKSKGGKVDPVAMMVVTLKPEAAIRPSNANKPVRISIDTTPAWLAGINDAGARLILPLRNWKP
ncbi:HlyD family efflux transporter periplasmic adaptor subunit [Agrobacterium rosae]|uniref:Alginate biosynthesis protein Alg44 n=1 Tax=Agrobacterium rosae TaxID=1972867 RepID=A0A1R3U6Z7_9HYPH|nr:HlyD family efflux transporter periplasmic adaptor subunit [Agrobacterium rosae]KAA3515377.1 HlyD family efflux transporter periplasmic adaptor subunit [Agrobacterium rosae]KAA3524344.1 HlyD family efflux transporter periplasmic adaptor subunit [Agrobacterium rosae]MBN7804370.1 HlyD family efflux transporter periplasmic adaptor subunit [Agrobacterium rosae]MCM2431239.1 HlyD family efflux transporter periplasmic adaptor subunit [Agrobacterium rosae]MDX8302200.1 HlyD family efflux transporter